MADDRPHLEAGGAIVPFREPVGAKEVSPFIPADFPSVYRFAELLAASGDMVPKAYLNNPQKISTAIFFGYEIGLLPLQALQSIAVINGKPSIYGDAALALVRGSQLLDDFEEIYEGEFFLPNGTPNPNFKAICKITRVGAKRPTISEFSIGDAVLAGLWNKDGPWRQYPKRMLKMRARGFGLRDEFTDVLRGMILTEEAHDIAPVDITPGSLAPPDPDEDGDPSGGQNDAAPKRRGRPRKNQYDQSSPSTPSSEKPFGKDATGEVEDVQTEVTAPAKKDEPAKTETRKEPEKTADAKPAATNAPAEEKQTKASDIYVPDLAGVSAEIADYLNSANAAMMKATGTQELRSVYGPIFQSRKLEPTDDARLKAMLAWHKQRVAKLEEEASQAANSDDGAGAGGPPDPEEAKPVFNFEAFKAELESNLGEERKPEGVNAAYGAMTEIPLREGLITPDQEAELKEIWARHLERVDF
jgi:hypothetical protein